MMTLYHVDWCPECETVRRKLADLNLPYEGVIVPDIRPFRRQVFDVSGQYYVPVLKDSDVVLTDTHDILAHLDNRYGNVGEKREASGQGEDASSCRLSPRTPGS